jgi:hypothetical protein
MSDRQALAKDCPHCAGGLLRTDLLRCKHPDIGRLQYETFTKALAKAREGCPECHGEGSHPQMSIRSQQVCQECQRVARLIDEAKQEGREQKAGDLWEAHNTGKAEGARAERERLDTLADSWANATQVRYPAPLRLEPTDADGFQALTEAEKYAFRYCAGKLRAALDAALEGGGSDER